MKILVVVESRHIGNTKKVAEAMAEAAPVTITDVENAGKYNFHDYDIVGFGSGIYYGKHDKKLIDFVSSLSDTEDFTFVFSTSGGSDFDKNNNSMVELLTKKNKIVLGTFACKGLDKFFVLRLFGGTNKGHPDMMDLDNAKGFICDIVKKYEERRA